ncbi:carboxymuconolactone decarboxylase family protein [Flexivirga sp. ID2601S]|uniref:Carboxymuconolactone decarboxylase family protein n=1 Tax=Flexivirga aerilata TaxID=1656889 RepID=A0A849ABN3_9MICO|nr:carboxymuconolactone decarboxylase family protein [Flexivirga aerilata]NNG37935.1 carboxymuconolactone decarboxylase family protein [Flexivirga aerilata]
MTDPFRPLDPAEADPPLSETLRAVALPGGGLPEAVARMAHSPVTLQTFLAANARLQESVLPPYDREVVILTVAVRNGCEVCITMHSNAFRRLGADDHQLRQAIGGAGVDSRIGALRSFTLAMIDRTGAVTDDERDAFLRAGYSPRAALEVALIIGTYTISTFANRLTRA